MRYLEIVLKHLLLFAAAILVTGCGSPGRYELVHVIEVAGRQGIATDGERCYVSGSKALYTYSKRGELLHANEDPFKDLAKPANHFGDLSEHNGELYTGIEWFEDGRGKDIQIAVYDAKTLKFKRAFPWNPDSGQVEVSALAVDPANDLVWMTDWVDGSHVYKYRLTDGAYVGKVKLNPAPKWQQGIAVHNGSLYITADDGDADLRQPDNLYRVVIDPMATEAKVTRELVFDQLRGVGEIEGIDFDHDANQMLVHANRGKRIVRGMPKGFYPGYDREIREVYVFRIARPPTDPKPRRDYDTLFAQIGTDPTFASLMEAGALPVGRNSTDGMTGSTIDVNNALLAGLPTAGNPIPRDLKIHTLCHSHLQRKEFAKWSRWYQEDGHTQVFRLFEGEHNVRNSRANAARVEAFGGPRFQRGDWHEWQGTYTIIKPHGCSIFQSKNNKNEWSVMINLQDNGDIKLNHRRHKEDVIIAKNMTGKSFHLRVRDNGHDYEVYLNGELVGTGHYDRPEGHTTFRWGMYVGGKTLVRHDAMIFVTGATMK